MKKIVLLLSIGFSLNGVEAVDPVASRAVSVEDMEAARSGLQSYVLPVVRSTGNELADTVAVLNDAVFLKESEIARLNDQIAALNAQIATLNAKHASELEELTATQRTRDGAYSMAYAAVVNCLSRNYEQDLRSLRQEHAAELEAVQQSANALKASAEALKAGAKTAGSSIISFGEEMEQDLIFRMTTALIYAKMGMLEELFETVAPIMPLVDGIPAWLEESFYTALNNAVRH